MPHPARILLALVLAVFTCLPAAVLAATDPEDGPGLVEHPSIARFPGFFLYNAQHHDFNEFRFASQGYGPDGESRGDTRGGVFWYMDFYLKEGARPPSAVELQRNFDTAFVRAGAEIVRRNQSAEAPHSTIYRQPLAAGSERWIQLTLHNAGQRYEMHVVETAAMAQKLEFSARDMADRLKGQGRLALHGIQFETGKAVIQPASQPLLQEVRQLLLQEPQWRLSIEGHTDNVGSASANAELSTRRAQAVLAYLVSQGIAAQRLQARGKGDTAPVADNGTEAGRARNRRVELVRLP
ncbi:OmpA family protein [Acidovorax sp. M2(2025)]|uniref:OmpA family protein n=1 Tax=Acidovorax sp. M2(2025) TaxID=3411355 RepID=UPI003BF566E9